MYVHRHASLPRADLPGIAHVTLAGSDQGLRGISIWEQALAPGAATPPHSHACEEVVLCRSGRGELHVGERVEVFEAGCSVVLPAGVVHTLVNSGDAPLAITGVFAQAPVTTCAPDGTAIPLPWRS